MCTDQTVGRVVSVVRLKCYRNMLFAFSICCAEVSVVDHIQPEDCVVNPTQIWCGFSNPCPLDTQFVYAGRQTRAKW